jgi:alpha-D-ribose 1-methylphosphonate 5-triphosphate synthase subunit PhnG
MATIVMPDRTEVDPALLTVSNLTRLGDQQFDVVFSWITAERTKRAERAAAIEAEQEASRRRFREQAERVEKNRKAYEAREFRKQADAAAEFAP